jgi:rRNA-processing protein FCF1
MNCLVLDAGALIAVERGDRRLQALLERVRAQAARVVVPAGVVAEVWRNGARQARIAKLLAAAETEVVPLDNLRARAVGVLLGHGGAENVIDASVVLSAREQRSRAVVVTGDAADLRKLDPTLSIVAI